MKLSEEQINQILEEAKPSIINGLRDEAIQSAKWELNPIVGKLIQNEVEEFIKSDILPEVKKELIESKNGLLSIAIKSVEEITTKLAESMAATLSKKLESSWEREKILSALFK